MVIEKDNDIKLRIFYHDVDTVIFLMVFKMTWFV